MVSFGRSSNSERKCHKVATKQTGMQNVQEASFTTGQKGAASKGGVAAAMQGLMTIMVCTFVNAAANLEVEVEGSGAAGAGMGVRAEEAVHGKKKSPNTAENNQNLKAVGGAWAFGGVTLRIRASCEASAGLKAAAAGKAQGQMAMDETTASMTEKLLSGASECASVASKWWRGNGKPDAATTEAVDGVWARVRSIENLISRPYKYTKTTVLNAIHDALTQTRPRNTHFHEVRAKLMHLKGDVCVALAWDLAITADHKTVTNYLEEAQAYRSSHELCPTNQAKALYTNAMSVSAGVLIDLALALELATHHYTTTKDAKQAVELSTRVLEGLTGCTELQRQLETYARTARASALLRLATASQDVDTQLSLLDQGDKDLAYVSTLGIPITFLHVRTAENIHEAITSITTPALPPPVIHTFKPRRTEPLSNNYNKINSILNNSSSNNNNTSTDNSKTTASPKTFTTCCARVCGSIKAGLRKPFSSLPSFRTTVGMSRSTRAIMDLGRAEGLISEGRVHEAVPIIDGALEVLEKKAKHAKLAKFAADLKARATAAASTQQ